MEATELLRTAGWLPGRKVDVIALLGALVAEDFGVTETAARLASSGCVHRQAPESSAYRVV